MSLFLLLAACGGSAPRFPDPAAGMLARLDRDGSGSLSADELQARDPATALAAMDTDGDGVVSLAELRADLALDEAAGGAQTGTPGGGIGMGPPLGGPPPPPR